MNGGSTWAPAGPALAATIFFAGIAGAIDLTFPRATLRHVLLVAALPVLASGATKAFTRRDHLAVASAAALALWPLPHFAAWPTLLAALVVGAAAFALVESRTLEASAGIVAGGLLAAWILETPSVLLVGAIVAGGLIAARPRAPTEGFLRFLRASALFLPVAGIAVAIIVNASTRRAEHLPDAQAVLFGAALAGVLLLASLALLGLSTLLESREPRQRSAWLSVSLGVAIVTASLWTLDPDRVLATLPVLAVPLSAMAVIALARLAPTWPRLAPVVPFAGVAVAGLQWGVQV